jgi:hypothetical protein
MLPSISLANAAAGVEGLGIDVVLLLVGDETALVGVHPASATVALASAPASRSLRSGDAAVSIGRSPRCRVPLTHAHAF